MRYVILSLLIFLLNTVAYANSPTLINGVPVGPGEYPEVIRISSCEVSITARCYGCSAAIVGKRAVITAGHCVANSDKISFTLNQNHYEAICDRHPLYPDTEDMDMAMCMTARDMEVKYASIAKAGPVIGETVTLIGYGCTSPDNGGSGGNDGILRAGESSVYRLPTSSPVNNWYYTRSDVALCFGDSGGPSFRRVTDPKNTTHYIMGINSRGNILDRSLLTAVYLEKGITFMGDWAESNNLEICGINSDCPRDEEPDYPCLPYPPFPEPKHSTDPLQVLPSLQGSGKLAH